MTSTPDESYSQTLYITSNLRKFQEVKTLADYTRIASRISQSAGDRNDKARRPSRRRWLMAWSLSDKLVLVDITVQTFALIAGILALLIVAGVLIL
jgi:hypothetical protein